MSGSFAAIDLGAESGRVILAKLAGGKLSLETIHRFASPAVKVAGTLRWDVLAIWHEIQMGLKAMVKQHGAPASVGVDSWGVDYVLTRAGEPLVTLPFHYRDDRCVGGIERAETKVTRDEIFAETGIQFMPINTLYQLHEDVQQRDEILKMADAMLLIADYFNWLLSGTPVAEESLASTTQLYNPVTRSWSAKLIERLGIPKSILPKIVPAGTDLGPVAKDVATACGLAGTRVIATCSHDTAAAVAAVPAGGGSWAYLSSGTWSLLGAEVEKPVITPQCRSLNFTNEVGVGGSIRLLKNIIGLWPLQECRREWQADGNTCDYVELTQLAGRAAPLRTILDLADPRFMSAGEMRKKIIDFARETSQPTPDSPAEFTRCVLESLALAYRQTLAELEQLLSRKIDKLHIVGGGSQSELLNQMTADALGIAVVAGPAEATAIGNALVQAIALKQVAGLPEARQIVAASFPLKHFAPKDSQMWAAASEKLASIRKNHA